MDDSWIFGVFSDFISSIVDVGWTWYGLVLVVVASCIVDLLHFCILCGCGLYLLCTTCRVRTWFLGVVLSSVLLCFESVVCDRRRLLISSWAGASPLATGAFCGGYSIGTMMLGRGMG